MRYKVVKWTCIVLLVGALSILAQSMTTLAPDRANACCFGASISHAEEEAEIRALIKQSRSRNTTNKPQAKTPLPVNGANLPTKNKLLSEVGGCVG